MRARSHRTSATSPAFRRSQRRKAGEVGPIFLHLRRVLSIRIVVLPHILPNRQRAEDKWDLRSMWRAQRFPAVHRARELILVARILRGGVPDQFLNRAAAEGIICGELQHHASILGVWLGIR